MNILEEIRKAVEVLDEYLWEDCGTLAELKDLSTVPGVYKITDDVDEYIGRAIRKGGLDKRIREHLSHPHKVWEAKDARKRFKVMVHKMSDDAQGVLWATIVEAVLIYTDKPTLNRNGKRHAVLEKMV